MNTRWPTTALLRIIGVLAVLLLWSLPAAAVQINQVEHTTDTHPDNFEPYTINRADCEQGTQWEISLGAPDSNQVLSWWVTASGDCLLGTSRTGTDPQCFQVGGTFTISVAGPKLLSSNDIANALGDVDACVDSTGVLDKRGLDLYLLVNAAGNDLVDGTDAFLVDAVAPGGEIDLDLVGPAPPLNVAANVADDDALSVTFDDPMSDVDQFYVYCAPAGSATSTTGAGGTSGAGGSVTSGGGSVVIGGAGGTGGAATVGGAGGTMTGGAGGTTTGGAGGTTTTAGTGGGAASSSSSSSNSGAGGSSSGECVSADGSIVAGELPSSAAKLCGQGSGPTSVLATENMVNGTRYALAVAATDSLGNPGALSELACGTPQSVTDFFEQYRAAGGQAGGGFCNCAVVGADPDGSLALSALALLALAAAWRRERRGGHA